MCVGGRIPALEKSHAMVELGTLLLQSYEESRRAPGSGISMTRENVCIVRSPAHLALGAPTLVEAANNQTAIWKYVK